MADSFSYSPNPYEIGSSQWRAYERDALITFSHNARVPAGFGYLDSNGIHQDNHGCELWINGRFTHIMACEVLRGNQHAQEFLDHGVQSLLSTLRDPEYDGWFSSVAINAEAYNSSPFDDPRKHGYSHAFVILAAASALKAKHPDAEKLFKDAHQVMNDHFWEPEHGKIGESFSRDWHDPENYRGINANMHYLECLLASFDATQDTEYLQRAIKIVDFVQDIVHKHDFRLPEHYTVDWTFDPEYNKDKPSDPFRPWGATIGHGFEWARLMIQTAVVAYKAQLLDLDLNIIGTAISMYNRAFADGWHVDGQPGFVYTTDFEGTPVVHERMHWVVCEALNAAHTIKSFAQEFESIAVDVDLLDNQLQMLWEYAAEFLILSPGRWIEELDKENKLSTTVWTGMPEIYHAYQTLVYPDGDYALSFCGSAGSHHYSSEEK